MIRILANDGIDPSGQEKLEAAGYEHYEVSNFALPGWRAVHNGNYWRGHAYLGVGPSAHSFDGARERSWNVAHNARYVRAIATGQPAVERERLSDADRYNELLLTGLRTSWGVTDAQLERVGFRQNFLRDAAPLLGDGLLERYGDAYRLTRAGRMRADGLSAGLFVV